MPPSQVAPGVYRLTHGISNYYIVDQGGKLTLVDAGVPNDWNRFNAALRSIGRQPTDLEAIVLTHAHSDHTGFAERARSSGATRVWVHRADEAVGKGAAAEPNEGKSGPYLKHLEAWRTLFGLLFTGGLKIVPVHELSTFEDGAALPIPGQPTVHHVPGHTAGSSALHFPAVGALFTGDALVLRNPLTGRRGPQIMPSAFNQSSLTALDSLSRIQSLPAQLVLTGHGEPWTGGVAEAVRLARSAGRS